MNGSGDSSVRGDGFVAATKSIVGGIDVQFVLPDRGQFDDVAANPSDAFAALDQHAGPGGDLVVPRFKTRFSAELSKSLNALGLGAMFEPGGLLGVADDKSLAVSAAIHETYLAVDEEGVEAAAATALGVAGSALDTRRPVPVRLDRPFLVRIVDGNSGATLFVGRIADPTA